MIEDRRIKENVEETKMNDEQEGDGPPKKACWTCGMEHVVGIACP